MTIFWQDVHNGKSRRDVRLVFQNYQFLHLFFENQIVKVMHVEEKIFDLLLKNAEKP